MPGAVMVFTRDLRVHDHPALHAAARAGSVVPAFVFDDAVLAGPYNRPNRVRFLLESLADLGRALTDRGARLVLRRGDWVDAVQSLTHEVGADEVHVSDDVSGFAQRRLARLERALAADGVELRRHPGVTVVEPGAIAPGSGGAYQVFTPYYRRWLDVPRRAVLGLPPDLALPGDVPGNALPDLAALSPGEPSPDPIPGGEAAARRHLDAWGRRGVDHYPERHDDLAADATSRLGAALKFGCVSPAEVEARVRDRPGGEAFVRQLAWRDFYAQVLADRPDTAWDDYRSRGDDWNDDDALFAAWAEGRTGYPVVDAAMRQLRVEGFVHNRARMIAASFLTKDCYVDWRRGARHFLDWLVDGDIANNNLNWQWTAGTGTDTNPHRIFNPTRQGQRFDPDGDYVRRYVPELASVDGGAVHEPWLLPDDVRDRLEYPEPVVDHHEAVAEYRARQEALSAARRR